MPIRLPFQHNVFESGAGFDAISVKLDFAAINWQAVGEEDPYTRLLARVSISGVYHHLEARQVMLNGPTERWESIDYPDDMYLLEEIAGDAFDSFVEHEGRTYYLFMTPYC